MKVMLIDDESMALENLKHVIEKCNGIDVVGAFTDPLEACRNLQTSSRMQCFWILRCHRSMDLHWLKKCTEFYLKSV